MARTDFRVLVIYRVQKRRAETAKIMRSIYAASLPRSPIAGENAGPNKQEGPGATTPGPSTNRSPGVVRRNSGRYSHGTA